ncbi:tetratricopeptide repeat-containing sensor histidine kinase [Marinoscillum sp.]|uniref:tetratricopeptide repeat-containing sensor histidine kinase n=1 Tax=Marinoscillum sp. TaxID=2024838 RepID=UPI003BA92B22
MLKNPPNDSVETRWVNSLFGLYMTIDMDSALYYGERAKELAETTGDSVLMASNILNFGGYYWYQSDFTKAMGCYVKAAAIFDKLGSETDMADAQLNIAILHLILGQTKKAKPIFQEVISVYEEHNYYTGLANAYNTLGVVYDEEINYDSAIYCFENCVKAGKNSKMLVHESWGYSGLGEIYKKQGRYDKSREYQMESLKLEEQIGNTAGVLQSYILMGSLEKQLGNLEAAENYLKKAAAMPELEADFLSQRNLYQEMVQLYETTGEVSKAYQSYRKHVAAVDSIKNSEDLAVINELNEKYESEKKANEIITLQKESELNRLILDKERNQKWLFGGASILFLILSVAMIFGYFQLKKSKNQIDKQNQLVTKINKALNRSQDELLAANKTKDKFFALVAHDLRGPVTSMQGIGRMLSFYRKKGDEHRINQLIEQVDQSSASVNHLLDNLLQWALSQTNGLNFQPEVFETKGLVEECMTIFTEGMKAKEITITVEQEADLMVEADYNMISTVLRNLLSNALKFSPIGGVIQLSVSEREDCAEITVTDSGQGMPEETIRKIQGNEPVESTRGTQDEKGTGLGLVLCREFIRLHGQELSISSSDRGTSISFQLQLAHQMA